MSVRSAQSITTEFTTRRFDTGVATNADSLPSGTLYVNGTADAASVTVTNQATGKYKAAVTLPTLAVGDVVSIVIAATVNSITDNAKVWEDTKDFVIDSSGYVSSDIQTIKTQSVTCASGVTVPSQIASPTNITAATGITVSAIGANVITATSIANDAITDAKVASDVTIASVTGNIGGNVTGSVGSIATGGITSGSFAAGAIDASAIATDAIGSNEISAAAVTKIQTGLATPTNITAATGITVSAIGANVITSESIASHAISQGKIDVDNVLEEFMLVPVSGYELEGSWGDYFFETGVSALDAKNNTITLLARITSGLFTGITSLAQWLGAMAGKQTPNSTAQTEINATGAGSGTYSATTDSQEATRDRGDSAWGAGAVPSAGDIADAVWNEAIADHVGAGSTGQALNAVGAAADPWITTLPGSYTPGQAGYIIGGLTGGVGGGLFSTSFVPGATIEGSFRSINGYDLTDHTVSAYKNGELTATTGSVVIEDSSSSGIEFTYALGGNYENGDTCEIVCKNVAGEIVAVKHYAINTMEFSANVTAGLIASQQSGTDISISTGETTLTQTVLVYDANGDPVDISSHSGNLEFVIEDRITGTDSYVITNITVGTTSFTIVYPSGLRVSEREYEYALRPTTGEDDPIMTGRFSVIYKPISV